MDIIKYEAFLKVVDRGSYNKACEDLGYTLSGISKMMKSMEEEIGVPLIIRNNKGITLTTEGERVLPLIRQLISYKDALEEEFSLIRGIESGKIRIGSFPTTSFAWIPKIMQKPKSEHPNIEVEILEENSIKQLEKWLNQGIIDVGIFSRQPYHAYDWFGVQVDTYVALLPKAHPLTAKEIVTMKELLEEDFILFKSHEGIDQDVFNAMRYVEFNAMPKYTSNSDFSVIHMVEQNDFVTLIPRLIAEHAVLEFDVEIRPVDIDVNREIGFAVRDIEKVSPAVRQLIKYIKNNEL